MERQISSALRNLLSSLDIYRHSLIGERRAAVDLQRNAPLAGETEEVASHRAPDSPRWRGDASQDAEEGRKTEEWSPKHEKTEQSDLCQQYNTLQPSITQTGPAQHGAVQLEVSQTKMKGASQIGGQMTTAHTAINTEENDSTGSPLKNTGLR